MNKTMIGIGVILLQAILITIEYITGEGLLCIPVILLMIFNCIVQGGDNGKR